MTYECEHEVKSGKKPHSCNYCSKIGCEIRQVEHESCKIKSCLSCPGLHVHVIANSYCAFKEQPNDLETPIGTPPDWCPIRNPLLVYLEEF